MIYHNLCLKLYKMFNQIHFKLKLSCHFVYEELKSVIALLCNTEVIDDIDCVRYNQIEAKTSLNKRSK